MLIPRTPAMTGCAGRGVPFKATRLILNPHVLACLVLSLTHRRWTHNLLMLPV